MKVSSNKKAFPARQGPQPFNRQVNAAPQFRPAVAQLKTPVSAQSSKNPVAPPVYRPQSASNVLLRKTANHVVTRKPPAAPPVYRPQQTPKVLQKKSALSPNPPPKQARVPTPSAPPVYRPVAKKILQPKTSSLPQNRPDQKGIVQPGVKMPPVYPVRLPQPGAIQSSALPRGNIKTPNTLQRFSVVQRAAKRKRDDIEYKLDYVLVPDPGMESYRAHVKKRTRHFFTVILNAIFLMKAQGGAVGPALFTDHAAAQEAKGFRLGKDPMDKIDAAHYMNVTLVPAKFPVKNEKVEQLYRESAATSMEFQKANIGPDKQIDSQQSRTKNAMLKAANPGPVNAKFLRDFVFDYLTSLKATLTVELPEPEGVMTQARAAAYRAVVEDLENLESVLKEIEAELWK
jgi:hypothetical protein